MLLQDIISEIKLELTGTLLEIEIDDTTIESVVKKSLRELERYWDETKLVTVPFSSCIELGPYTDSAGVTHEGFNSSAIVKVYRTEAYGDSGSSSGSISDPMFAQQWMLFSNGGTMYNLQDYMLNYASWTTLLQIKNTMSTDLSFKEDKHQNKLYINHYLDKPGMITIEYIPKLTSVEDIQSDYWIDILIKLSTAMTKVILGRIRTRFTQSNALYSQDGERMLEEGNTDLKELREILRTNSNLVFGID